MADNSRYYWIKLRTDFFNQQTVDFILSQKNGCEYIVLYQMLCLQTANNNGELSTKIGEIIIPYDVEKIVRDTKYFDFDTVTMAIELFKRLGLIYESDDTGVLRISDYALMIGSESASKEATKKRKYRANIKEKDLIRDLAGDKKSPDKVDKKSDRYKILDIRDKDIRDIDNRDRNNINIYADFEAEFDTLWKSYPRKEGKTNALKAYIKARTDKKAPSSFEEVKEGLDRYVEHIKAEKIEQQYIKHGSTWFNQRCWNDEYNTSQQNDPDIDEYKSVIGKFLY